MKSNTVHSTTSVRSNLQNGQLRRKSSIIETFFTPSVRILNLKNKNEDNGLTPNQIKEKENQRIRKEDIIKQGDEIVNTTILFNGGDDYHKSKREDLLQSLKKDYPNLLGDEWSFLAEYVLNKLDDEMNKNEEEMKKTYSILIVGLISISDLVSDIVCIYLYLISGNDNLIRFAYISIGFLVLSLSFGTLISWITKGPCKFICLFLFINFKFNFVFHFYKGGNFYFQLLG